MRRFVMRKHGMEEHADGGWVMHEEARTLKAEIARLQADLELARLALEEAVVLLDEHKFKDVWTP